MKKKRNYASSMADFLRFFLHIYRLNQIQMGTIANYDKQIAARANAIRVLKQVDPEKQYDDENKLKEAIKENIDAARQEVANDFFTIKTSLLVLIYSRMEAAISEIAYQFFESEKFENLPDLETSKFKLLEILRLAKKEQRSFLAELFIQQRTLGVNYGFKRFEAIIEPLFGVSVIKKECQDNIFKFAQIRNLLIHKNGIVDKKCQELLKLPQKAIGKKINIKDELLERLIHSIVEYSSEIINRIKNRKV